MQHVIIWDQPYDSDTAKEAIGCFTLEEAAAKLRLMPSEVVNQLDAEGFLNTPDHHAEWDK